MPGSLLSLVAKFLSVLAWQFCKCCKAVRQACEQTHERCGCENSAFPAQMIASEIPQQRAQCLPAAQHAHTYLDSQELPAARDPLAPEA